VKEISGELIDQIRLELGFRWKREVGYIRGGNWGYSDKSKLPIEIDLEFKPDFGRRMLTFSFTGCIWSPGRKDCVACGQIDGTLRSLIKEHELKYWMNPYIVKKILDYWEKYHLNDIKPVPEERAADYIECQRKAELLGIQPDEYYDFMKKCYGPDYGNKWYAWRVPNSVYRWLLYKFCGLEEKDVNHLVRLKQILEGIDDEV